MVKCMVEVINETRSKIVLDFGTWKFVWERDENDLE